MPDWCHWGGFPFDSSWIHRSTWQKKPKHHLQKKLDSHHLQKKPKHTAGDQHVCLAIQFLRCIIQKRCRENQKTPFHHMRGRRRRPLLQFTNREISHSKGKMRGRSHWHFRHHLRPPKATHHKCHEVCRGRSRIFQQKACIQRSGIAISFSQITQWERPSAKYASWIIIHSKTCAY